ncbi:MAG TPA: shikimate dehydrogenase, partial [Gammaproteobacteria bacterium]|nr:shikimate dehydrogenase [Gammaproteobacteria bacterium]
MPAFNLKPDTDNYCLAGNPVSHSKSPLIHAAFAKQTGQNMFFQIICVERNGFHAFLNDFRSRGGKGMNITLPFKEEAWQLSDRLTPRAEHARAVNTIMMDEQGRFIGDNTDGAGLVNDLEHNHGIRINKAKVLIMGAGGAARGIIEPLLSRKPERMVIANRTVGKAQELAGSFSSEGNISACGYPDLSGQSFELVINATSASLEGEVPAMPDGILATDASCYDLMYSDRDTAFVSWARQKSATKCLDGTGMLVEQAAESFYFWR